MFEFVYMLQFGAQHSYLLLNAVSAIAASLNNLSSKIITSLSENSQDACTLGIRSIEIIDYYTFFFILHLALQHQLKSQSDCELYIIHLGD